MSKRKEKMITIVTGGIAVLVMMALIGFYGQDIAEWYKFRSMFRYLKNHQGTALVINVRRPKNGPTQAVEIRFAGQKHDLESLTDALKLAVKLDADRRGRETGPGGRKLSKLEIIVQPDQDVLGENLRKVFVSCQQAGIEKIKLSALLGKSRSP